MKLAFQDTSIELNEVNLNFDACRELDYTPYNFGLIPFSETISDCEFDEPTVMFGGTKLVKMAMKNKLPKNGVVFYDRFKFDQFHYHSILRNHLLNENAKFGRWGIVKYLEAEQPTFIKPSSDLKYFPGTVVVGRGTVENEINNSCMIDADLNDDITVMYNTDIISGIKAEYRAFVIDNKIIDISGYTKNGQINHHIVDTMKYQFIAGYISAIQQIYKPHDHYVIDIADVNGTLKVMEYNCINCSGMYKIDRGDVFEAFLKL